MNIKRLLLLALLCFLPVRAARTGFEEVDRHALAAPASAEHDLKSLAAYLCPSDYTSSEKARSIFRWVADRIRYDVDGLRRNRLSSQAPEDVLTSRKAVCEGYALLVQELGKRAGLSVETIIGASKFNSSMPFELPPGVRGHAWNAVQLDGQWALLDVTWAAGQVQSDGKFRQKFDDFWFCPPAEQFVYTHLPTEPRWQLLDRAWDQARWDSVPRLSSDFFRLGLKLGREDVQPLQVSGERLLRWDVPRNVVGMSDLRDAGGKTLEGWTFTQSPDGRLETRLRCPRPGRYILRIFARVRQRAWQANVDNPSPYQCVAEYQVESRAAAASAFPKTFGSFQRGGAELLRPLRGALKPGSQQQFHVRAPGADEVALFQGSTFLCTLTRAGGHFRGKVSVPPNGPLQVCARYPQESHYWGLVEFDVRD